VGLVFFGGMLDVVFIMVVLVLLFGMCGSVWYLLLVGVFVVMVIFIVVFMVL